MENFSSTYGQTCCKPAGQNGGSLTETVVTQAGVPLGLVKIIVSHQDHQCCHCMYRIPLRLLTMTTTVQQQQQQQ